MIKLLQPAILAVLVSCGGGGSDSPAPVTPVGGTTSTPPSYAIAGEVLSTECVRGPSDAEGQFTLLLKTIADGKGGSTEEKTPNSTDCEYVDTTVEVTRREGDYFKGALIDVESTGEWDYLAEAGHVTETDTGIEITSDGQLGVWSVIIDGESYEYEFVEAPVCEHQRVGSYDKIDCLGNDIGSRAASMIYYGEDDTQIVTIEIGIARTASQCGAGPECADGTPVPADHPNRLSVEEAIREGNAFNAKHNVYIRWELTEMVWLESWYDIFSFGPPRWLTDASDVVYGWGGSGPNGGQAFMPTSIYPTMRTPTPVGRSMGGNGGIFLHELGHAMGLGHGVWGVPDWQGPNLDPLGMQGGSLFPWFGHGWDGKSGEAACGAQGSVMSYGSSSLWTNSLIQCSTLGYPNGNWGDQSGSRLGSDEAYALNRIRYSYSLIHNEHVNVSAAQLPADYVDVDEDQEDRGILIHD